MKKKYVIGISIFLLIFSLNLIFADNLINIMQTQTGLSFVAEVPSEGFFTYFKLAFMMTFVIMLPIPIYMLIKYIRPSLYKKEEDVLNQILGLTKLSIMLFITGTLFGAYMIFKVILPYLTNFNQFVGYQTLYNADYMIMFIVMSIFYTGIIFQIPIINYYLFKFGILKIKDLKAIRIITIMGALIIGSIITPPDVLSQLIFSLPIWLLFEVSTIIWRYRNDRTNRNISNISGIGINSNLR